MIPEQEFDVSGFLHLLRQRIWLIVAVGIAAAGLAFGISSLQAERYEASAGLLFRQTEAPPRIDPTEPPPDIADAPERVAATNLALASLDSVASRVKERLNRPEPSEELREEVDIEPQGQADIVTITASAGSPEGAARLANAFAEEVVAVRRENAQARTQRVVDVIDAQLATAPPEGNLAQQLRDRSEQLKLEMQLEAGDAEIAEEATPPREPSAPKPLRNSAIGLVLGLLLGVMLALLLKRMDRRVHNEDAAAEIVGSPVIGRIPVRKEHGWQHQLYLESFQLLRANLQLRRESSVSRTLAVTSTLPGEGKSTVVMNLAEALAMSGSSVIVVDCDLRRPRLHTAFGVAGDRGLTTALISGASPLDLLVSTPTDGVRLLPAGPLTAMPGSFLLGAHGVGEVIGRVAEEADFVIIDTSPATIGADASAVAAEVDATLMVVDVEMVERKTLALTVDQLRSAQASIAGVVLNRAPTLVDDRAYQGYYGDSKGIAPSPQARETGAGVDAQSRRVRGVRRHSGNGGKGSSSAVPQTPSGKKEPPADA